MACRSVALKSLFYPFPSPTQEPAKQLPKKLFAYGPNNKIHNRAFKLSGRAVAPLKQSVTEIEIDQTDRGNPPAETYRRLPFSDVKVVKSKRSFWARKWTWWDITRAAVVSGFHFLSLLAPFYFNWAAFGVFCGVTFVVGLGMTLSYHRLLSHRSFKLPKWLEYFFSYCGCLSLQGDPIDWASNHRYHHQHCDTQNDPHSPILGFWYSHLGWIFDTEHISEKCGGQDNVDDLKSQPFYRFLQKTWIMHAVGFAALLYMWGGMPFLVWGSGVSGILGYHATFFVNSVCHIWGNQAWNTGDLSKNSWWVALLTLGEGWHNNHHAFEYSARHGLEWWQVDVTWGVISFLQALGLATDVKLPTEAQKKRMAFPQESLPNSVVVKTEA